MDCRLRGCGLSRSLPLSMWPMLVVLVANGGVEKKLMFVLLPSLGGYLSSAHCCGCFLGEQIDFGCFCANVAPAQFHSFELKPASSWYLATNRLISSWSERVIAMETQKLFIICLGLGWWNPPSLMFVIWSISVSMGARLTQVRCFPHRKRRNWKCGMPEYRIESAERK